MASRMTQQHILHLNAERNRVQSELEKAKNVVAALEGELKGYLRALAIYEGQPPPIFSFEARTDEKPSLTPERKARGVVKDVVLRIVAQHADAGVRTSDIVDFAAKEGVELDRNSVASLLSRLSREETLVYDKETRRYRPTPRPVGPALRTVA